MIWYEYYDTAANFTTLVKAPDIMIADSMVKNMGDTTYRPNPMKLIVCSGVRFVLLNTSNSYPVVVHKVKGYAVEWTHRGIQRYVSKIYNNPVDALKAYNDRTDSNVTSFKHDALLIMMPRGHVHLAKNMQSYT